MAFWWHFQLFLFFQSFRCFLPTFPSFLRWKDGCRGGRVWTLLPRRRERSTTALWWSKAGGGTEAFARGLGEAKAHWIHWDCYQVPHVVTETNLGKMERYQTEKLNRKSWISSQSQFRCFFVSKARYLFDAEHPSKLWLGQGGEEFIEEASTAPRCVDCINLQQHLGREHGNICSTCSKTLS